MAAALALVACWRPAWNETHRFGWGLLASGYPLIISLIIKAAVHREGLQIENFGTLLPIDQATVKVLGDGFTLWLWLMTLTSAWCLLKDRACRRWVLGFLLGFMLTCINPFLDEFWGGHVTAKYLVWRLLWVVPLPVFLALLVTEALAGGWQKSWAQRGICCFMALVIILMYVRDNPLQDQKYHHIELKPGLKVKQPYYDVAKRVTQMATKGTPVLVPYPVALWVPTFRQHPYPPVARRHYTEGVLAVFASWVDTRELRERLALYDYISGKSYNERSGALLERWLREKKIAVVAVPRNHKGLSELSRILHKAEFVPSEYLGHVIFDRGEKNLPVRQGVN